MVRGILIAAALFTLAGAATAQGRASADEPAIIWHFRNGTAPVGIYAYPGSPGFTLMSRSKHALAIWLNQREQEDLEAMSRHGMSLNHLSPSAQNLLLRALPLEGPIRDGIAADPRRAYLKVEWEGETTQEFEDGTTETTATHFRRRRYLRPARFAAAFRYKRGPFTGAVPGSLSPNRYEKPNARILPQEGDGIALPDGELEAMAMLGPELGTYLNVAAPFAEMLVTVIPPGAMGHLGRIRADLIKNQAVSGESLISSGRRENIALLLMPHAGASAQNRANWRRLADLADRMKKSPGNHEIFRAKVAGRNQAYWPIVSLTWKTDPRIADESRREVIFRWNFGY